jgi:hypothetical protein
VVISITLERGVRLAGREGEFGGMNLGIPPLASSQNAQRSDMVDVFAWKYRGSVGPANDFSLYW